MKLNNKMKEETYTYKGMLDIEIKECSNCKPKIYKVFFDRIRKHNNKPVYYIYGIAREVKEQEDKPTKRYYFELAHETSFPISDNTLSLKQDSVGYIYLRAYDGKESVLYDRPHINVLSSTVKV